MAGLLVVFFPLLLLGFMLFMERVEKPLTKIAAESDVEEFLDNARAEDVDNIFKYGVRKAVLRWRRRRRVLPKLSARMSRPRVEPPAEE